MFWGGFLFCSSSSLAAVCFQALSSLTWDPVVKWGKSSVEAGLDCPHSMSYATEELLLRKGKGLSATPFLGAGGRKHDLECCRDSHGKETINWESFQEISSKLLRFSGVGYVCLQTHMKPLPLYQTSPWCWKRKCLGRKIWCLGTWRHIEPVKFAWLTQTWHLCTFNLLASSHLVQLLAESRRSSECSCGPSKSWGNTSKKQPWCAGAPGSGSAPHLTSGSPWKMGV